MSMVKYTTAIIKFMTAISRYSRGESTQEEFNATGVDLLKAANGVDDGYLALLDNLNTRLTILENRGRG